MPNRYATAGDRNTHLMIQRRTGAQDAGGTGLDDFEDVLDVWAEKKSLNAREFIAAAAAQSEISGILRFDDCEELDGLNHKWRAIELDTGVILNFVGTIDIDGRSRQWTVYFTESDSVELEDFEIIDDAGGRALIDSFGTNFATVGD